MVDLHHGNTDRVSNGRQQLAWADVLKNRAGNPVKCFLEKLALPVAIDAGLRFGYLEEDIAKNVGAAGDDQAN